MDTPLLSVLYAGSLFPRGNGEFRVHSVFASAVNLVGSGDPYPVALLTKPVHRHPRCAVLGVSSNIDLVEWGLNVGATAVLESGRLRFEARGLPDADLLSAKKFNEEVSLQTVMPEALAAAVETLGQRQKRAGMALRLDELRSPRSIFMKRFAQALGMLGQDFEAGARPLVGLGDGLTPTGDDFLVGWLAAARLSGRTPGRLDGLKAETNMISASFLDSAERGLFPAALVELAESMAEPERAVRAVGTLATIGYSSGLDAATGFLAGLQSFSARGES